MRSLRDILLASLPVVLFVGAGVYFSCEAKPELKPDAPMEHVDREIDIKPSPLLQEVLDGSLNHDQLVNLADCGRNSVRVKDFCIDQFEAPNERGELPLAAQGAYDAVQWCAARGKHLCSDDEWYDACHEKGNIFPYGNRYVRGQCVDDKQYRTPNWNLMSTPQWPAHAQSLYQAEPAGSRPGCVTPSGVYDMDGNVAEWVREPRSRWGFVVKGCSWIGCYGGQYPNCGFVNNAHAPQFKSYEFGFRCCGTPKSVQTDAGR